MILVHVGVFVIFFCFRGEALLVGFKGTQHFSLSLSLSLSFLGGSLKKDKPMSANKSPPMQKGVLANKKYFKGTTRCDLARLGYWQSKTWALRSPAKSDSLFVGYMDIQPLSE